MPNAQLFLGDCLTVMRDMPADSIDAIVTDPPYMINFMNKKFDRAKDNPAANVEVWAEMLRVAKPGAHLLAFGGDRTHHRMMCAIEDAGWELRTCLYWAFGQGFPKSHSVDKAIDKHFGAERERISGAGRSNVGPGTHGTGKSIYGQVQTDSTLTKTIKSDLTLPATDAAKQWLGWGSALKPAVEIIVMARKPLSEPTIAANVLKHGTGALNIDGCRIEGAPRTTHADGNHRTQPGQIYGNGKGLPVCEYPGAQGRWPANLLLSDDAAVLLDEMSGELKPGGSRANRQTGQIFVHGGAHTQYDNGGGASRFFLRVAPDDEPLRMAYVPKASRKDRNEGLEEMEPSGARPLGISNWQGQTNGSGKTMGASTPQRNTNPCVKPVQLMRWLVRLVTPPGGTVLDPFAGSGSTLKAAILEGFDCVGIELDPEYLAIAEKRIDHARQQVTQMSLELP